ncbi:MAG: hypothetical protein Q8N03_14050 [Ignavibacteria bacterium]|nr:hypothetical protein [Ignavibacteria bacterium]
MKKQSLNIEKSLEEKSEVQFCTECEKELDKFFLNPIVTDRKALKLHFNGCKDAGKFKGEICSKLFISLDDSQETTSDD